ncbi:Hpt domain-containing protein [Shewanella sp.]|uniref:Hpt domain-containing protein n=1 Tax=Shewanella sp. TaxID=50422 RepID=UPI003567CAAF
MNVGNEVTPGLELRDALERMGGNCSLLHAILAAFHEQYQDLQEQLHSLAENDDRQALLMLCHTLKGAAANIGALRLVQAAAAVEAQVKHGDFPIQAVLIHECIAAWDELSPTLAQLLARTEQQETFCITASELRRRLVRLRHIIESDFAAADAEFMALRHAQVPGVFQGDFILFIKQFDAFDMQGAKASICRMLVRPLNE